MRCHANARLSPIGSRLLVDRIERDGWTVRAAAESAGISERTARKWLARFRAEGAAGLRDRSSAPRTVANRTDDQTVAAICALRRLRFSGPELAELLDVPSSTVSAVLKRCGRASSAASASSGPSAMNANGRVSRSTSTSRSSDGSLAAPGTASLVRAVDDRPDRSPMPPAGDAARPAGTSCTSRSTTPVAWPTPKCSPMRRRPPPVPSSGARSSSSPATGMTVERVLTDNGSPTSRSLTPSSGGPSGSVTCAPVPTGRRPRQGLCLRITGPSEVAARLPAPVGLTQAKACRRSRFLLNRCWRREPFSWPAFDLSTGGLRAGRRR